MLRISHDTLSPQEIAAALALDGTFSSKPGDIWFLIAQPSQSSRDSAFHIDWLLRRFSEQHEALQLLRKRGCRIEIVCFWESISGNGGPSLDRELLADLAHFPLDRLGFDFRIDEPPWGSDQESPKGQTSVPELPAGGDKYMPVGGRTYVTLRIYHDELSPEQIGSTLGLEADRVARRGEVRALGRITSHNGWFFGSDSKLGSSDVGLHLTWLVQSFKSRSAALQGLRERGCQIEIACFWESETNASGPVLSGSLLLMLSMLSVDYIWFDVYFDDGSDREQDSIKLSLQ